MFSYNVAPKGRVIVTKEKMGSVRIIAGEWRSRKLPVADIPGLRPTTDRVRETLFNWLQHSIVQARCLDLFAGTGALGLEAASRGAAEVVMIECDRKAFTSLQQSVELLKTEKVKVSQADALNWLEKTDQVFDIIFIDPPFDQNLVPETLEKLMRSSCVKTGTLIYVEEKKQAEEPSLPESLEMIKQGEAGQVRYSLLEAS